MRIKNFWLQKRREKNLLKVVEWAQKNRRLVETLSRQEILDALRYQR